MISNLDKFTGLEMWEHLLPTVKGLQMDKLCKLPFDCFYPPLPSYHQHDFLTTYS